MGQPGVTSEQVNRFYRRISQPVAVPAPVNAEPGPIIEGDTGDVVAVPPDPPPETTDTTTDTTDTTTDGEAAPAATESTADSK
jgi:hypothetical protein